MSRHTKVYILALVLTLTIVLGIGGALVLRMHRETPSIPEKYDGGTLEINFAEGTAHSAGEEVLVPVPTAADTQQAGAGSDEEQEEKGIGGLFRGNGLEKDSSLVSDETPADVWAEDRDSGYTGFTTRAQLPASDSIGVLEIPSIGLSANVYDSEDDMADMDKGLSHFQTTSYWDGNIAFAGHNGNLAFSFFGKLHNVKKGDTITYQTEFGTRSYVVSSIRTIADDDWSSLERTDDNRLTLITCVSDPSKRLCVQAVEQ